jgi:hypothetical protein
MIGGGDLVPYSVLPRMHVQRLGRDFWKCSGHALHIVYIVLLPCIYLFSDRCVNTTRSGTIHRSAIRGLQSVVVASCFSRIADGNEVKGARGYHFMTPIEAMAYVLFANRKSGTAFPVVPMVW